MNIAFIVDHFPRISETFILSQITGLIDRGHSITVYATTPSKEDSVHEDVYRYELIKKTIYRGREHDYIQLGKRKRIEKSINIFKSHFPASLFPIVKSLNIFKYGKKAFSLENLMRIAPFIGRNNHDVIVCHFGPNGKLGGLLKNTGVFKGKIITFFHGYDISMYVRQNGKNVYDELFKSGDLFLSISDRWKNELISLGCPGNKILVHHMGIDPEKYNSKKKNKSDLIKIISVGRFVEKKGIRVGIEAIGKIKNDYGKIEYMIVGDGELRVSIEEVIRELNIGDRVRLLGWKTQEEIIRCMEDADILLAPSHTSSDGDQEGIPMVLMEAMAMGMPVVTTKHSGIPELVKDNFSGFLAEEGSVPDLVERLAQCLNQRDRWLEIGKAGRETILKDFNIHLLNDRLVDIFQGVMNS